MNRAVLKKELDFLGLLDKAHEIHSELGGSAVLSYIKSSHRLLSKVYHPDLNPGNTEKATMAQQRLNRVSSLISSMNDEEIIGLFSEEASGKHDRKAKVLVVEDEFGLQEIFRDVLQLEGYDVKVAVDGANGYDVYCRFKPDLIFTDVVMPNMSGLELVRKIRETEPDVKVVYVSGFFGIKRLKDQLDEDVSIYGYPTLAKPFKASKMLELVRKCLNGIV